MTIKRSLTARRRRDFRSVFGIAATNKPAKITLTYAIALKLSDSDGEFPNTAANILSEVAGLCKSIDSLLGRPRKSSTVIGNPANMVLAMDRNIGVGRETKSRVPILVLDRCVIAQRVQHVIASIRGTDHRGSTNTKKADVVAHLRVCDHVGLLSNEPPGAAGLLFIQSSDNLGLIVRPAADKANGLVTDCCLVQNPWQLMSRSSAALALQSAGEVLAPAELSVRQINDRAATRVEFDVRSFRPHGNANNR